MDYLWSPWRYNYVTTAPAELVEKDFCLFCRTGASSAEADDEKNLVVFRGSESFVILNRYPYASGHVMIAPYQHAATLEETGLSALEEMMRLARKVEAALRRVYRPEGFNIGLNVGKCAGAGIAGHIHMHILPRWMGDTNFVTTIGETRVLPEDLQTTFHRVREALREN